MHEGFRFISHLFVSIVTNFYVFSLVEGEMLTIEEFIIKESVFLLE